MNASIVGRWCIVPLLVAAFCAALTGCGKEAFQRHEVSGTVTYQGAPVERGMIIFEPKESVGRQAPTCYVVIRDGAFRSPRDESPAPGQYRARVFGLDVANMPEQVPGDEDNEGAPPLFPEYVFDVEIPPPNGRLDIEVPDEAAAAG
jgi:hypothetical protein